MLSLVRWEPSFAPNYPSAVSFWVKLLDVPTHIVDDAILKLVGNFIGKVEGIKLDVSLNYDKLVGLCIKCFKLTHDEKNCPEAKVEEELAKAKRDEKGKGTYAEVVTNNSNEHIWENPKRSPTKRALDFNEEERHAFPYKKVGRDRPHGAHRENQHMGREEPENGNQVVKGRAIHARGSRGASSSRPKHTYQVKATAPTTVTEVADTVLETVAETEIISDEGDDGDSAEKEGDNQEKTKEKGTLNNTILENSDSVAIDFVNKALSEVELRSKVNKELQNCNPKLAGLPGRKYSSVVLASPKKRLLLNMIYGSSKSTGKGLNLGNKPCSNNLPKKYFGEPGKNVNNKGEGSKVGNEKGGLVGGGIPKHSIKK
ncbi:unnamed protein product [Cochlearia groenlandica]